MKSVFVVQHLHRLPSGEDSVMFIGVYRTVHGARKAVERLSSQPGFSKHPFIVDFDSSEDDQGFHVSEYELDKDHWAEGFVTMVGVDTSRPYGIESASGETKFELVAEQVVP